MLCIHLGTLGSWPFFGRPLHCLAAIARKTTPRTSFIQFTASDDALPAFLEPPATLTITRRAPQPMANAGPLLRALGVASIRITAMIGSGLRATPIADGSKSP